MCIRITTNDFAKFQERLLQSNLIYILVSANNWLFIITLKRHTVTLLISQQNSENFNDQVSYNFHQATKAAKRIRCGINSRRFEELQQSVSHVLHSLLLGFIEKHTSLGVHPRHIVGIPKISMFSMEQTISFLQSVTSSLDKSVGFSQYGFV